MHANFTNVVKPISAIRSLVSNLPQGWAGAGDADTRAFESGRRSGSPSNLNLLLKIIDEIKNLMSIGKLSL